MKAFFLGFGLFLIAAVGQASLASANVCHALGDGFRSAVEIVGQHPWDSAERDAFKASIDEKLRRLFQAQAEGDDTGVELAEADIRRFLAGQIEADIERAGASANHREFLQLTNELRYKTELTQILPSAEEAADHYDALSRVHIKRYANRIALDLQEGTCEGARLTEAVEVGVILYAYPTDSDAFLEFFRDTLETTVNNCDLEGWVALSWTTGPHSFDMKPYFFRWSLGKNPVSNPNWRKDMKFSDDGQTIYSTFYGDLSLRTASQIEVSKDYSAKLKLDSRSTDKGSSIFVVSCLGTNRIPQGRLTAANVTPLSQPGTNCVVALAEVDETSTGASVDLEGMSVGPVVGSGAKDSFQLEFSCNSRPAQLSTFPEPTPEAPENASFDVQLHFGPPPIE